MARAVHSTYFKVRHRVTGLFHTQNRLGVEQWSHRGKLFRNMRQLHGFLVARSPVPREWEVLPVELVVRDDRAGSARAVLDMHKYARNGKGKKP